MAEKDLTERTLESYGDVFSDIMNVLLFHGEHIITEESLVDADPRSMYKADGKLHEQERDVVKYWNGCGVRIAMCGFENQTDVDPDMPLRVISYDGAGYRAQLGEDKKKREEGKAKSRQAVKRYPVLTMVLYFGKGHWTKYRCLRDRLEIPECMLPFISDYRINVYEISWLTDKQVQMFTSDFRIVADFFVQTRKTKDYHGSKQTIRHVDEILKMMTAFTRDIRFEEVLTYAEKGEIKNMCDVLDKIEAKGQAKGELIGEARGQAKGEAIGEARGQAKGEAIGEARGQAKGEKNGTLKCIISLMGTMNCSAEKAMQMLCILESERDDYLRQIKQQ